MNQPRDLRGMVFGRLTAIERAASEKQPRWVCKCVCGAETTVLAGNLTRGHTTSCGCYKREVHSAKWKTHGMSGTKIYNVWKAMRNRCGDPKNDHYADYGGRGITVCERWQQSFSDFYADVGDPPPRKNWLDRIENDKGYGPSNFRWTTPRDQQNNRRDNVYIKVSGKRMTIADAARALGLPYHTLYRRLNQREPVLKRATPAWADMRRIAEFYANRPPGMTVDHMIPLVHELVCGLHVHQNLQYLPLRENSRKKNQFNQT